MAVLILYCDSYRDVLVGKFNFRWIVGAFLFVTFRRGMNFIDAVDKMGIDGTLRGKLANVQFTTYYFRQV